MFHIMSAYFYVFFRVYAKWLLCALRESCLLRRSIDHITEVVRPRRRWSMARTPARGCTSPASLRRTAGPTDTSRHRTPAAADVRAHRAGRRRWKPTRCRGNKRSVHNGSFSTLAIRRHPRTAFTFQALRSTNVDRSAADCLSVLQHC